MKKILYIMQIVMLINSCTFIYNNNTPRQIHIIKYIILFVYPIKPTSVGQKVLDGAYKSVAHYGPYIKSDIFLVLEEDIICLKINFPRVR